MNRFALCLLFRRFRKPTFERPTPKRPIPDTAELDWCRECIDYTPQESTRLDDGDLVSYCYRCGYTFVD